jgi:hypothetical protein
MQKKFTWKGQGTRSSNNSSFASAALMEYIAFFNPRAARYSSVSLRKEYPLYTVTEGSQTYQDMFHISNVY